jgi:hypothetical protein
MSTCKTNNPKKRITECNKIIINKFTNGVEQQCLIDNNKLEVNGIKIILGKILGKGIFGIAYNSTITINNNIYEVAIKFFEPKADTERETILVNYLSKLVIDNISPHFLSIYHNMRCNQLFQKDKKNFRNYQMFIMEKADNNIETLLQIKSLNLNEIRNIVTQIFLAIYTFHQYTHCYHNDTNVGNILYMYDNTKDNKLYYQLLQQNYVLNAGNYLIILWDYGLVEPIINNSIFYDNIFNFDKNILQIIYNNIDINNLTTIIHDYLRIILQIKTLVKSNDIILYLDKIITILLKYNKDICDNFKYMITNKNELNKLFNYETVMILELIQNNHLDIKEAKTSAKNTLSRLFHFSINKNKNPYILNNNSTPPTINISSNQKILMNIYRHKRMQNMQHMIHYQYPFIIQRHYGGNKNKLKCKLNQLRNLSKSK